MKDDNIFTKAAYTSIGLILLGAQKAEGLIKSIGDKANIPDSEVKLYMDKLTAEADNARTNFQKAMQEEVRAYLKKLDVPTREDYEKLQQQILVLQQEIALLKKPKPKQPNGPR